MRREVDLTTAVVGAGWAGLGVSHCLQQRGLSHCVFERGRIGETWRSQRWDSFHFNTPRSQTIMPGQTYSGDDPDGAMPVGEFVTMLEDYVSSEKLPVMQQNAVRLLRANADNTFELLTDKGSFIAGHVVIATGHLNRPIRPNIAAKLPSYLHQIDTSDYRNAGDLPPGAVLVVGSAQSGGQIAEDLAEAGRRVFLATSKVGRGPRIYRGRHIMTWMVLTGLIDTTRAEMLSQGGIAGRPLHGARHTISLQALSRQGVMLLGKLTGTDDKGQLRFASDLSENIRFADESSNQVKAKIDAYIERTGMDAPAPVDDPAEIVTPHVSRQPILLLDPIAENIRTVVWCTGFKGDFSWANIPGLLDDNGDPIHVAGVSNIPGLMFAGLDFAISRRSGTILAIAEEAERFATLIGGRVYQ